MTTVLGSAAPALSVKLMQVFSAGSKDASIIDQVLHFFLILHVAKLSSIKYPLRVPKLFTTKYICAGTHI